MKKILTEVYSRVVGYYRPVAQWNKGMRAQFNDRKTIKIDAIKEHLYEIDEKKTGNG